MPHDQHRSCIDACVRCAQECEHCARACLEEADITELAECIRLDHDCAHICWAAASLMSRGSPFADEICRLCADVCAACGSECAKHEMDHCRRCADACQRCANECRRMAATAA